MAIAMGMEHTSTKKKYWNFMALYPSFLVYELLIEAFVFVALLQKKPYAIIVDFIKAQKKYK